MSLTNFNRDLAKKLKANAAMYDVSVKVFERKLVVEYSKALKSIQSRIQSLFAEFNNEPKYYKVVELGRLRQLELSLAKEIQSLNHMTINTTNKALEDLLLRNYDSLNKSINTYSKQHLNVSFGLATLDKATINAALINPMDKIGWDGRMSQHSSVLNSEVRSNIVNGLIKGDSYQSIAKVTSDRTNVAINKIVRIVRTEAHRIQSTSNLMALDSVQTAAIEEGYEFTKVWLSTLDNRTRDSHVYLDGQEANEDGLFELEQGGTTEGPGLSGIAEEDINCRCIVIMQLGNARAKTRLNNETKNNIPYDIFSKLKVDVFATQ